MECNSINLRKRLMNTALLLAITFPANGFAATNSFEPDAGGSWSVPSNWSLGHTPVYGEDVEIYASDNVDKSVTYGVAGVGEIFDNVTISGHSAGYDATLVQMTHLLETLNLKIGEYGDAHYRIDSSAYLWVKEDLYVGHYGAGDFYLATDAPGSGSGVEVDDLMYVGYSGPGQFDHFSGGLETKKLYVGQNDYGKYNLGGTVSDSQVDVEIHLVIGNADVGVFEQTGGTLNVTGPLKATLLGLNSGGVGQYLMKGGVATHELIALGWNGVGSLVQTGGVLNVTTAIQVGYENGSPGMNRCSVSDVHGAAVLNIGTNLHVGQSALGEYEQNGGTVTVGEDLLIWRGTSDSGSSSSVYLGLNAGTLSVGGEIINYSGYYDQDGGIASTTQFTNQSSQGINLDNNAELRANTFINTQGTVTMWRNARLIGRLVMPPNIHLLCNFTNAGGFQMGNAIADGGAFVGNLTNNGTFDYYQGDFSGSSLINNSVFNCEGPFECRRFEQNGAAFSITASNPITASGTGYSNAIENNSDLSIDSDATVYLGADKPLVNNGDLNAAGTVDGDLDNNGFMSVADGLGYQQLHITGDFTQSSNGTLHLRLGGTSASSHDRVSITGDASLDGQLSATMRKPFVPTLHDSLSLMRFASSAGTLGLRDMPGLSNSAWKWALEYDSTGLFLTVVVAGDCDGDDVLELDEWWNLEACLAGPGNGLGSGCTCSDLDNDGDVTVRDAGLFQAHYEGL